MWLWWFSRGAASIITVPVFLVLILGTLSAFLTGLIQTWAYFTVGALAFLFCVAVFPLRPGAMWWATTREVLRTIMIQARTKTMAVGFFIVGTLPVL